jgi:3-dehydrosphinganine reductase
MGLEVGRQLAEKGANIAIVARDPSKLLQAIEYISQGALHPSQRFHHISADLTSASECVRVVDEATSWNAGKPPDTVWCCAGSSYPDLFIDTPVEQLQAQMDSNYFSSAHMAHAVLTRWLKPLETLQNDADDDKKRTTAIAPPPARHLIFTASFVALYSFACALQPLQSRAAISL